MKIKQILFVLFIFTFILPSAWAESGKNQKEVIIRGASVAPEGTPWEAQLKRITKHYQKDSSGLVRMKTFLGGQKGDEKSIVRQCKAGRLDFMGVSTAAVATEIPALQVLELPYLFNDSDEADFILDNYLYEPVRKLLEKNGFVLYQWAENGWQNIGTREKAVESPEDLKGLKIRSQEAIIHLATWKGLGASPQEISVSEVLPALNTGVVDGFAQTPLFTFAAGWHQAIKHYTLTNHLYQPGFLAYSKKFFDQQPKDVQTILLAHKKEDTAAGRKGVRILEPGLIENFKSYGIQVHELTPAQQRAFKSASQKVRTAYEKSASSEAKELLALIDQGKAEYQKLKK